MRLLGKRQLGEIELSEFVLAALIADLAAHPLQDIGIPMINGLVPILTLFCCEVLISGLSLRSIRLRVLLFGKPSFLIEHGVINQKEMKSNRFTLDELMQELRKKGVCDISKVEYAVLETDGTLNVLPFAGENPPSASELGIQTEDSGYTTIVINDGKILDTNLSRVSWDKERLDEELRKQSIYDSREVYLMTVNAREQCYICRKELGT